MPGKKNFNGGGGGRVLIPYKERNDRGREKEKKKKLTRDQRNFMAYSIERDREENKGDTEEA